MMVTSNAPDPAVLLDSIYHTTQDFIDDFGTGYSALSYPRDLPVTGVPGETKGCSVIKAVGDLSRALELEVVAEGVETGVQANFLRENACEFLQGYLMTKPLRADAITAWLEQRKVPAAGG